MGATDPGSAREEAERLVAAALATARTAAAGARARGGPFGQLGEMISGVLDQVTGPEAADPGPARPGTERSGTPGSGSSEPSPASESSPASAPAASAPAASAPAASAPAASAPAASAPAASAPAASAGTSSPGPGPAEPGSAGSGAFLGHGFATGSAECCVCPVCRAIAALRDPSPELTERLATGAGDFAAGVASLLRALSAVANATGSTSSNATGSTSSGAAGSTPSGAAGPTSRGTDSPPGATGSASHATGSASRVPGPTAGGSSRGASASPTSPAGSDDDQVWRMTTRTGHDSWPADEPDVWATATRAASRPGTAGSAARPARSADAVGDEPPPAGGRRSAPVSRAPEEPVPTGPGTAGPGTADEDPPGDGG